jgi:hypothetical protein
LGPYGVLSAPHHHLSVLSRYSSFFNSPGIIIDGCAFSRLFEFQSLMFLAGTVSFTHAVAALIRCFAVVTVARADPQLVNRFSATLCTFADVGAVVRCQLLVGSW